MAENRLEALFEEFLLIYKVVNRKNIKVLNITMQVFQS